MLYKRDRQLHTLDYKMSFAKSQLSHIVNTKVFSKGNTLVHELDHTNRQMRLLKDNVFRLEDRLTEKIRLCYDRELDEARASLSDIRKQFTEYQDTVSAMVKAKVRDETNNIDGVMKSKAEKFKDLATRTKRQSDKTSTVHGESSVSNFELRKIREQLRACKEHEKEARDEVVLL